MSRRIIRSLRVTCALACTLAMGLTMGSLSSVNVARADDAQFYYEDVPQSSLEAIMADSEETQGERAHNSGPINKVLDGDVNTYWHSVWQSGHGKRTLPHYFIIGVRGDDPAQNIGRVTLGTRQSSSGSGRAKSFEVYVRATGACTDTPDGWTKVGSKEVPSSDLGDQSVEFNPQAVRCVKVIYLSSWDGSNRESMFSSLSEFNMGVRHEGVRPLPPAPAGTPAENRPLPAGAISSSAVLDPLAADDRRADNPDRTPVALRLPGGRVVGARPSSTPAVADVSATQGTNYFVDCLAEATGADGTLEHPYTKLASINDHAAFQPGDKILLKRGTVCQGLLTPAGSGSPEAPITIDAYGNPEDPMPVIHGRGTSELATARLPRSLVGQTSRGIESSVIRFFNQEHWVVRNLELTNYSGDNNDYRMRRRGVVVALEDFGVGGDFEISDLYIHDVLGLPEKDLGGSGGIQFEAYAGSAGVPTAFKDLRVHHNRIRHVSRSGINEGSNFRSRPSVGGGIRDNAFFEWKPMDVHDNILSDLSGDAIVTQFASGSQVYNNTVWDAANHHAGRARAGNNAGIWAWDADNVHYYNNHVFDMKMPSGTQDGTAFDADYGTTGTVFEYNVSHDNVGGFMLFCGCGGLSTKTVMRYNISINDGRGGQAYPPGARLFFVAGQTDAEIYNNTFLLFPNVTIDKGSSGNSAVYYGNNVFLAQGAVSTTWRSNLAKTSPFRQNLYAGTASTWPSPETNTVKADLHASGTTGLEALRVDKTQVAKKGIPIAKSDTVDLLSHAVPAQDLPDLGAIQESDVTEDAAKYASSRLLNVGFEEASDSDKFGWKVGDHAAVVKMPRGGKYALELKGASDSTAVTQTFTAGVNQAYRLIAAVKADANGEMPRVALVNPEGHAVAASVFMGTSAGGNAAATPTTVTSAVRKDTDSASGNWKMVSAVMRTAWDASTLTVSISGSGYVDDLAVVPVEDYMVDGSFQSFGNSPWTLNQRDTVAGSEASSVSGGLALAVGQFEHSAGGYNAGAENREVVVPQVGPTYDVVAWAKVLDAGKSVIIGAKSLGSGAPEPANATASANTFTQYSFTVKPTQPRFTVFCWLPDGGRALCDDFMLVKSWNGEVPMSPAIAEDPETAPETPSPEPMPEEPAPTPPAPAPAPEPGSGSDTEPAPAPVEPGTDPANPGETTPEPANPEPSNPDPSTPEPGSEPTPQPDDSTPPVSPVEPGEPAPAPQPTEPTPALPDPDPKPMNPSNPAQPSQPDKPAPSDTPVTSDMPAKSGAKLADTGSALAVLTLIGLLALTGSALVFSVKYGRVSAR